MNKAKENIEVWEFAFIKDDSMLKYLQQKSQNETGIIQWMRFMSGKNRKDFAKMAEQNEYIKEAYECLEKMSADERKRREYEERQKILWDHNLYLYQY